MPIHNILANLQGLVAYSRLLKSLTATLTNKEVMTYRYIDGSAASTQIDLTLPAAGDGCKGAINTICNYAAAVVTVIDPGGFGAGGNGTITLAQGECATVHCNGTNWHVEHNEPAA